MTRQRVPLGTRGLSDDELVEQFGACTLPNTAFHHEDHIRLAWILTRRHGGDIAEERLTEAIRRFATSLGHAEKFHETQTRAWARLVALAACLTPEAGDFDGFAELHRWLFNRKALDVFYSRDRLTSTEARARWVPPDRCELP